jgi:hypothetical protein
MNSRKNFVSWAVVGRNATAFISIGLAAEAPRNVNAESAKTMLTTVDNLKKVFFFIWILLSKNE